MNKSRNPFTIINESKGSGDNQIISPDNLREVSETFLVGDIPSLWLGKIVSLKKFKLFYIVVIIIFLSLFFRLSYLQFIKGDKYRVLAEGNRSRLEQIIPDRGIIFDMFGVPLVENVATFSLFYYPGELKAQQNQKDSVNQILKNLNFSDQEIKDFFSNKSYLPLPIKENLSYEEAVKLMIDINQLTSLKIVIDPQRKYNEESALAHLLGYTSRITAEEKDYYLDLGYQLTEKVGKSGLEEYYQEILRGKSGIKQIEVDNIGNEKKVITEILPKDGQNLFLSIDAGLQVKIYQVLNKYLPNKAGAVVAMDPNSGKVRAFVSWPTFNNNDFSRGISQEKYQTLINNPLKPLFNRLISGEYPSGSTIKLIVGLAGLEEDLITKNSSVLSIGGVWYDKWFFPDWKSGGHGYTNIVKAIAESVNTFFYYLALEEFEGRKGLGLNRVNEYFKKFGLGLKTGIDLYGEKSGFIPTKAWKEEVKDEAWYPGDTFHLVIGQGDILVTPLQVANYTSAIANNGILYKLQLLEKNINLQDDKVKLIESEIIKKDLASKENIAIIAQGMRSAVTYGSARRLNSINQPVAGKTGTAQVGGNKMPHSWFTGYLPYDNPKLVLTVLVENGGDSSGMAIPIAQEILNWYAENRF